MWKIRMERWLLGGEIKSEFDYELPQDFCNMLDSLDMIGRPAYTDSVFATITQHCEIKFAGSRFVATTLMPPIRGA